MTESTQEATDILVAKESTKETDKSKRVSLPVYTVSEIIAFCAKIYTELGFGDYHSKDLIAKIHGVIYDSIKQKFSTAQAYGLLELKHGVGYKLTDGFLKIYKPVTEKEKREGIIESIRLPEFYSKLLDELNGHPVPSEQGLSARLLRSFGIKDYAANKAAIVFLTNLKENGIVGADNIVRIDDEKPVFTPAAKNDIPVTPAADNTAIISPIPTPGYIEIPVPLNGGKRAYIKIPEDYKSEDCERIAKFVDALK